MVFDADRARNGIRFWMSDIIDNTAGPAYAVISREAGSREPYNN